jgi:hypothetical protein
MSSPFTRNLVTLAVLEGFVIMSAVMRFAFPELGGVDLSRPPQLAWFVGVTVLAGAAVAHFVVRSARLGARVKAGENVDDDVKQVMALSVAILGFAGLISLAGPQTFERFLG